MNQSQPFRYAIRASTELESLGKTQEAFKILDEALARAILEGQLTWIRLLSSHAVVLCETIGDISLSRHYCEQWLSHVPDDPRGMYDLAGVLIKQGQPDLAKTLAEKSYALATSSGDNELLGLRELLEKKWPGIGQGRS